MPSIMAPKFVSSPRQALSASSKKRLVALFFILIALPVTVILALSQQSFINRASGPTISRIEVSPGIVVAERGGSSVHISALAYDSSNNPVSGITYTWSMSSTNTVGTLTSTYGNVTEFKPLNYGCGQLTVSANAGEIVTKSISVAVSDGVNAPECGDSNVPTPTSPTAPTPTPIRVRAQNVTITNYNTNIEMEPGEQVKLMTVTSDYDQTVDLVGSPTNAPYISYFPSSLFMTAGVPKDVYIEASANQNTGVYSGEPEIKSVEYQAYSSALPRITVYLGVEPSVAPSPTSPPPTPADITPPTILNPRAINITETKATIAWETDEPASGYLDWGLTTSYGKPSGEMSSYRTDWIHNLSGLTPNTVYHFRITSTDEAGNESVSSDYTFRTLATGEPTPPPPTATPPQVLNANLKAVADSFVRGGRSKKNFGTKTFMGTHQDKEMISYMKFDLRSLRGKEIKTATLKFRVLTKQKSKWAPSKSNQFLSIVNNNWTERGITYDNKPDTGTPVTNFIANQYGQVITLDVTDVVGENVGDYLSFAINSGGNDMLLIYSRESNNQKPTLLIDYY